MESDKIYKILNATSNCPFGECDGNGITYYQEHAESKFKYCKCREKLMQDKRLKFANIPAEFKGLSVKSFNTELYTKDKQLAVLAKKAAVNYIKSFDKFRELGKGLYFYSETKGSGKTRLAVSVGNALIEVHKVGVKFIKTKDLITEIQSTYNKDSQFTESQLLNAINDIPVLILDDLGVEKQSDYVNGVLYSILDNRMIRKKITIFTSNQKIEELKHDERIVNRIAKMAVPINFPSESIREKLSKQENESLQSILFG